ncbi:MAG: helix-turn-helix domain-containing protein [Rhodobacteraceae bacterium]|nr:helix-turn-helix domain-containing protein [Paracoccaceae bacterium]
MKLRTNLPAHRKAAGLTQAQMAEAVGVSRKTINTIENRVFVPSTLLALKLARALKVSVHDLFELEDHDLFELE